MQKFESIHAQHLAQCLLLWLVKACPSPCCLRALAPAPWGKCCSSQGGENEGGGRGEEGGGGGEGGEISTDPGQAYPWSCTKRISEQHNLRLPNMNSISNDNNNREHLGRGDYSQTPCWVLHAEGCQTDEVLGLSGTGKCYVWIRSHSHRHHHSYFTGNILWDHSSVSRRMDGEQGPTCASCPLSRGLGKPSFLQNESAGTKWKLMESSAPWEKALLLRLQWKLRPGGRTLARKRVAFGSHWVGLTFKSQDRSPWNRDFQLLLTLVNNEHFSVFFHQWLHSLRMPAWP